LFKDFDCSFGFFYIESSLMKKYLPALLVIAFFLTFAQVVERFISPLQYVNPDLPNLYAPNYQDSMEPSAWIKVVAKDRDEIIDKVIVLNRNRPKPINLFRTPTYNGGVIDSRTFKGNVSIIYIWSTISKEGLKGLSELQEMLNKYKGRGVKGYGMVTKAPSDDFNKVMKEKNITFPTAYTNQKLPVFFHFFPTYIIMDKERKVRVHASYRLEPATLAKILDKLIAEQ